VFLNTFQNILYIYTIPWNDYILKLYYYGIINKDKHFVSKLLSVYVQQGILFPN
jgi:hypothetical protein